MLHKRFSEKIIVIALAMSFLGCVATTTDIYDYGFTPSQSSASRNRVQLTNIEHIYVGMTQQEIISIMGDSVEIGYEQKKGTSPETIMLKSPYEKEAINEEDHRYEVYYYFTEIKNPDGKITEDELVPLIFERDKLIGKGYGFLSKIKKQ